MRPRTITFIPLSTYCSTVLPTPLKQVIRCHSVSSIRRPLSSLTTLPLLSRLGREVARLKRSEEHTSELQSLMRISYAVFCLKKKKKKINSTVQLQQNNTQQHKTHI